MSTLPVKTLAELRARWREAVPAGSMEDFTGTRVVVGVIGATPVVMEGWPAILGTPELDAEFTRIWRKACGMAGIKAQEGTA